MTPESSQNWRWARYAESMEFDPDVFEASVVGCTIQFTPGEQSVPMHRHRRGQLLSTSMGSVRCELTDGLWPVPPDCALWIPGNQLHRSMVSTAGKICLLYLDERSNVLADFPCFVPLTPLVKEMIWHMASVDPNYEPMSPDAKVASALVSQLALVERERFSFEMPRNRQLRIIVEALIRNPANRRSVSEWAEIVGTSEKTLSRLLRSETGLSFVQWRQRLQLVLAIRYLKVGASVQQVAETVGYESTNAFATMFKKIMGKPPGHYGCISGRHGEAAGRRSSAH
jgi:AraC-like DNA-binding protein